MDKSRIAEWVLAKVSTQERAAEIVGDLLEQHPLALAFWASIVRIVFAMHWRWLIAVPAAMFSVVLAAKPYAETVVGPYNQVILAGPRPAGYYGFETLPPAMQVGSILLVAGVCLWTVAALALFRYGLRSGLTHLSGLLAVLFTAGACSMTLPYATVAIPALLALSLGLVLSYAPWRRLLLCTLASGATFLAGLWALGVVIGFCIAHLRSHQPLGAFCALGGYIACVVAEAWVLTTLHKARAMDTGGVVVD